MSTVGKRILEKRKQINMTRDELAAKMDVSVMTVYRWENGNGETITLPQGKKIAKILNTSAWWLLSGEGSSLVVDDKYNKQETVQIPIFGKIAAGSPNTATQDIEGYLSIPKEWTNNGEYYALTVNGDSMSPDIAIGDRVIIRQGNGFNSGDICAVLIEQQDATLKKCIIQKEGLLLQPLNTAKYSPMFFSKADVQSLPITIIGVVVEIRKKVKA